MATGRKTGGRQAGSPNKATSTLHELVEAEAGEPLPVLLTRIGMQAMKAGYRDVAISALSKAAAYVYPRVAAVEPPAPPSEPIVIRFVDDVVSTHIPCTACGHDPQKHTEVILPVIHDQGGYIRTTAEDNGQR